MSYLNVGVAFFKWWCVGKGGYCATVQLNCSRFSVLKYPFYSKCHHSPYKGGHFCSLFGEHSATFQGQSNKSANAWKTGRGGFSSLLFEVGKHSPPWIVTDHIQIPPCPCFIFSVWGLLACDRYVSYCAHSVTQSKGLVNSTANPLSANLSCLQRTLSLPFLKSTFSVSCSPLRLEQVLLRIINISATVDPRSWLSKPDRRWCERWCEEVSCWLIFMQPWTPL